MRRQRLRLALPGGRARLADVMGRERRSLFLLVSHRLMEKPEPIAELRAAGAAFIPLVHDLIPATHPEYARPGVAMPSMAPGSAGGRAPVHSNVVRTGY